MKSAAAVPANPLFAESGNEADIALVGKPNYS